MSKCGVLCGFEPVSNKKASTWVKTKGRKHTANQNSQERDERCHSLQGGIVRTSGPNRVEASTQKSPADHARSLGIRSTNVRFPRPCRPSTKLEAADSLIPVHCAHSYSHSLELVPRKLSEYNTLPKSIILITSTIGLEQDTMSRFLCLNEQIVLWNLTCLAFRYVGNK